METPLITLGPGPEVLGRALSEVRSRKVDDCDIYFEHQVAESLSLEEGLVKRASRSIHQGVGVRAIVGERTGYAHADLIDEPALLEAARAAPSTSAICGSGITKPEVGMWSGHGA